MPLLEVDLSARGGELSGGTVAGEAVGDRLHLGDDRTAQGRRAAQAGDLLQPRRPGGRLEWTGDDVLAHALPLFHVHGLILGILGPLRLGGTVHHPGPSEAMAAELAGPATMMFGVPTMYHRLAADAERDPEVAGGMSQARLLVRVGGAARGRPPTDHSRHRPAGRGALRHDRDADELRRPLLGRPPSRWSVGHPGGGGGAAHRRRRRDHRSQRRRDRRRDPGPGPNLFLEYLNRPDATAEAVRDGWFHTGDVAVRAPDGYVRIVGRRSTDLIKSGGYKIGAGEIENALVEHPGWPRRR